MSQTTANISLPGQGEKFSELMEISAVNDDIRCLRNGWAISQQVTRTVSKVAGYGALAATALLPTSLALATGVGAMGFHAVTRMRRSASNNSNNETQE